MDGPIGLFVPFRVRRPLEVMQHIEIGGGFVAAGLLLYWALPYLAF